MIYNVDELSGRKLDYAVAEASGLRVGQVNTSDGVECCYWIETWTGDEDMQIPFYHRYWKLAGEFVDLMELNLIRCKTGNKPVYYEASTGFEDEIVYAVSYGSTHIEAALRCFVKLKLGLRVWVPEEMK